MQKLFVLQFVFPVDLHLAHSVFLQKLEYLPGIALRDFRRGSQVKVLSSLVSRDLLQFAVYYKVDVADVQM